MTECRDKNLGILLHAYELNALSEDDTERFELHLLRCEHCFGEVKDFRRNALLLRKDAAVRDVLLDKTADERVEEESSAARLYRYLWPDGPIILKPGLAYLLALLLVIPAYYGLRTRGQDRIGKVQVVTLFPDRSVGEPLFRIGAGREGLLSFVFNGAVSGRPYSVVIETDDGSEIFREDEFADFDEYETGRLFLPLSRMKPGGYRLIISDPRSRLPSASQEYVFRIEE